MRLDIGFVKLVYVSFETLNVYWVCAIALIVTIIATAISNSFFID